MNASITFRLPALGRPCEDDKPPDVAGSSLPAASPSDEAVIEQICHGSAEALSVLFRRYARTIRGVAYNVLRDTAEADDLLQDIFLLVHRLCGTFDSAKGSGAVLDSPDDLSPGHLPPALSDLTALLHPPGSGSGSGSDRRCVEHEPAALRIR